MQIFLRKNILFLIIFLFCKVDFAKRGVFDSEINFPITSPIILLTPTKCYFLCLAGRCLLSFPERNRRRIRLLQSARYMTSMWGLHLFSAFSLSLASFCLFLCGFRSLVIIFSFYSAKVIHGCFRLARSSGVLHRKISSPSGSIFCKNLASGSRYLGIAS